ncbi:hypothetical protein LPJ77_000751 [Coemansia sp. RSA 2523]|nr:hypothetical protein LPJ54_000335 [Coemansia sp. RSA 1824]KAJ1810601.1 hypothetical protein LPJ77_000751 [Coemansia sp. RSA 2523]KAJ2147662.1 hypothetical protein IW142_001540 [Coemansia sp. RSA 564]KAJ2245578.1 hypothetical protein GGH97_002793 [Coemansia sp. RSA 475]KAJ2409235.1 hypothetical protein J3F80_001492 [Coemansia sp. RSA 2526]KAJ2429533.1 hypothetical protein GGF47_000682 [Coemansia sp. RSA 2524]KAJ2574441.1 hypothetical protein GGH19_003810 [Coemansia sp. RSA 1807]KAJ2717359.
MLADSESARSTLSLAHSLLQSRVSWLTHMFDALDTASCAQPRQLLGTFELQIGPHLFAHTHLYKLTGVNENHLALQFAENTSDLFWVPGDLGIDARSKYEGHEPLHLYFYAQPHNAKRSLRAEQLGVYCLADKRLTRIQVVVREMDQKLGDALVQYTKQPTVKVCRDYRHAMCVERPVVKYGWAFLPESQRPSVKSMVRRPVLSLAQRPVRQIVQVARVESSDVELAPVVRPVYRGGGKTGYTAAVAAARLKRRKEHVSDSDGSDVSDGGDVSVARKRLARK